MYSSRARASSGNQVKLNRSRAFVPRLFSTPDIDRCRVALYPANTTMIHYNDWRFLSVRVFFIGLSSTDKSARRFVTVARAQVTAGLSIGCKSYSLICSARVSPKELRTSR